MSQFLINFFGGMTKTDWPWIVSIFSPLPISLEIFSISDLFSEIMKE